jgi:penicillin-binding protein 1A
LTTLLLWNDDGMAGYDTGITRDRSSGPGKGLFARLHRRLKHGFTIAGWCWFVLVHLLLILGMAFLGATMVPYRFSTSTAPSPTLIYSSDGVLLASLYEGHVVPVTLNQVPSYAVHAILAAEDVRFYQHRGLDLRGILRAAWVDLRARRLVQGGSTITQQLVRMTLLNDDRTFARKLKEIILAVRVERGQTKSEILERYLNTVYFGGGAYGIGAAAKVYVGKSISDITPGEAAMLAGLIRAPSEGNPRVNLPITLRRRAGVLDAMVAQGWLSPAAARRAAGEPVTILPWHAPRWTAPYVVEMVRQQLLGRYGDQVVYHSGLTVQTTLSSRLQREAESTLAATVHDGRGRHVGNGALVALEPQTGFIRALAGGANYQESQFNRAASAHRQPGSSFKAFVYLAALEHGYVLTDLQLDAPITVDGWSPKNYGDRYHGVVSLRAALAQSMNSVAVRLARNVTPASVAAAAREAGITSRLRPTITLALGTGEVTPLEMARAYATFATGGTRVASVLIVSIADHNRELFHYAPDARSAVNPRDAFQLTQGLRAVMTEGTGRRARIGRPAAGKTGTTDDFRDAWFVGYTPYLSTAVWLGNDDRTPMTEVAGGTLPAAAWARFMLAAHRGLPVRDFDVPAGMARAAICADTGLLALPVCPRVIRDYLPVERIPADYCPLHYWVARRVCTDSRLLARKDCPHTEVGYFPYNDLPSAVCAMNHRPQPPVIEHTPMINLPDPDEPPLQPPPAAPGVKTPKLLPPRTADPSPETPDAAPAPAPSTPAHPSVPLPSRGTGTGGATGTPDSSGETKSSAPTPTPPVVVFR